MLLLDDDDERGPRLPNDRKMKIASERIATNAMIPGTDKAYVMMCATLSSSGIGIAESDGVGRTGTVTGTDRGTAGSVLLEMKLAVTTSTTASTGVGVRTGTEPVSGTENDCNDDNDEKYENGSAESMVAFDETSGHIDAPCGLIERRHHHDQFHGSAARAPGAHDDSAGGTSTAYARPWNDDEKSDDDNGDETDFRTRIVCAPRWYNP